MPKPFRMWKFPKHISTILWWEGILLLSLFRLFLCAREEIVPITADSENYAQMTLFYLTSERFDFMPTQRPGLSLLARFSALFGLPYKIFLDLLMLAVACWAAVLVRRNTRSGWMGILVFAAIAINPWFINQSRVFMTEPLAAVYLLALVAMAARWLLRPVHCWNLWDAIATGVLSAGFSLTRPETPVAIGFWGMTFAIVAVVQYRQIRRLSRAGLSRAIVIAMVPFAIILASTFAMKELHERQYGVDALSSTEAVGARALLSALYSIPPEKTVRYVPVPRSTLALACEHSPTLNRYRDRILDLRNSHYVNSKARFGVENEAGPWTNWLLVGGFTGMKGETNAAMLAAADEIRQAQSAGKLGYRRASYPIDPCWEEWTRDLPTTLGTALQHSFVPQLKYPIRDDQFRTSGISAVSRGFFEDGLRFRRGNRRDQEIRLYGICRQTESVFESVRVATSDNRTIGFTRIEPTAAGDSVINFSGSTFGMNFDGNVLLEFGADVSRAESGPYPLTPEKFWNHVGVQHTVGEQVETEWWAVQAVSQDSTDSRTRFQQVVLKYFFPVLWGIVGISFLAGLFTVVGATRLRRLQGLVIAAAGLILGRSLYYALVEVWMQWGMHRYVEPNHLVCTFLVILSAFVLGASFRRWIFWWGSRGRAQWKPAR